MGECGCSQFQPDFRMPGPNKSIYLIMVYSGCDECGTPAGIDIHRVPGGEEHEELQIEEGVDYADKLRFHKVGDIRMTSIPVLHVEKLWKALGEEGPDILDARDFEQAVTETVNEFRAAKEKGASDV